MARTNGALARLPARLETERLVLQPWTLADAPHAREAIAESVDTLRPWVPWAPAHAPSAVEAEALVAAWIAQRDRGENLMYAIRRRDDGVLVGGVGCYDRVGPGRIELGYWIRRCQERHGFATEAAAALSGAALDTGCLREVVMHIHPANAASRRVPEKLGYALAERRAMRSAQATAGASAIGGDEDLLVFVLGPQASRGTLAR